MKGVSILSYCCDMMMTIHSGITKNYNTTICISDYVPDHYRITKRITLKCNTHTRTRQDVQEATYMLKVDVMSSSKVILPCHRHSNKTHCNHVVVNHSK